MEPHENQEKEHDSTKLDLNELGISFDRPQKEISDECSTESEGITLGDKRETTSKPVLEDLGEFTSFPCSFFLLS